MYLFPMSTGLQAVGSQVGSARRNMLPVKPVTIARIACHSRTTRRPWPSSDGSAVVNGVPGKPDGPLCVSAVFRKICGAQVPVGNRGSGLSERLHSALTRLREACRSEAVYLQWEVLGESATSLGNDLNTTGKVIGFGKGCGSLNTALGISEDPDE